VAFPRPLAHRDEPAPLVAVEVDLDDIQRHADDPAGEREPATVLERWRNDHSCSSSQ
jgi:hypothetical protein